MATASSVISVAIVGDARKFSKAAGAADKSAKNLTGSMKGLALGVGGALAGLFAVSKAFEFLGDSLNEADRAGDALGNLERIVGKVNAEKIDDIAGSFHELGLSSQDVLELSVGFARIGRAIGLNPNLIANYADDVASVAQALALADEKGRGAADFVEIIAKAASKANAIKPLGILGIKVNEAKVIAQALKDTGKASEDMLTPAEKAAARLLIIMKKLAGVVPDALANPDVVLKQAELQAKIEELQRQIGEGLQPIVKDLLQSLLDISESKWVDDMMLGIATVKAAVPILTQEFIEGFGLVNKEISEDVQQIMDGAADIADAFAGAFGRMETDVRNVVGVFEDAFGAIFRFITDAKGALGGIADLLNNIFGADHSATFQVNVGRAPRDDREIANALGRDSTRNGGP